MKLRFIVDTQLPPSLAEFLRRRNIDATHVIDYSRGALTSDKEIIEIAINEYRIVITKDSDFMDYYLLKGCPPSILLLQLGNIKNSELFEFLNKQMNQIISLFTESEDRLVIVRKNKIIFF
jgi:predicted nuclease of predicted toxin-antitoxin system